MHLLKHDKKVKATPIKDAKGRVAGYNVEDKQGRVAAVARPEPIRAKARYE